MATPSVPSWEHVVYQGRDVKEGGVRGVEHGICSVVSRHVQNYPWSESG